MHRLPHPYKSLPKLSIWLLSLFIICSGCSLLEQGHRPATIPATPKLSPLEEARHALSQKNYAKAEYLSQMLCQQTSQPASDLAPALQIYSIAATHNKHPNAALTALNQWRFIAKGVDAGKEWQTTWLKAVRQLSQREATNQALQLTTDQSRSEAVQNLGNFYLISTDWTANTFPAFGEELTRVKGELLKADNSSPLDCRLFLLQHVYNQTSKKNDKQLLEYLVAYDLQHQSAIVMQQMASLPATKDNKFTFPFNLIVINRLLKEKETHANQTEAEAALQEFRQKDSLADPDLIDGVKEVASISPVTAVSPGPIHGKPIVLALPLSGKYAGITSKIAAGAEAACTGLQRDGINTSLVLIDTEQSDWLGRISGLPQDACIVGGIIRVSEYTDLKNHGFLQQRAFFTFLSHLDGSDEGTTAWRFFPSQQDQVNALLEFTASLGIKGYAVFYPDEAFGKRMADLFTQKAERSGIHTINAVAYAPGSPNSWLRAMGNLLATNKNPKKGNSATFQAIFLPDTWKHMELIIPSIFYFGETQQLLMGSSLWEQELAAGNNFSDSHEKYRFAIFPAAWDSNTASPAVHTLNASLHASGRGDADFWHALGYDYARFAATLPVQTAAPAAVNSALTQHHFTWSMAPIHWEHTGKAAQKLYLFAPSETGYSPLNTEEFRRNFIDAWK